MFSLLNGVYDSYLAPTELNIIVVGASRAGKTTLLERIKVSQMPKRASQADASPAPLTVALHDAFAKGGAEVPLVGKASLNESEGMNAVEGKTTTLPPVLVPVVIKKRHFKLSICPAPSRYSKTAQDQDEEFVAEDEADTTDPRSSDKSERQEDERVPTSLDAPLRIRTHSKEFNVDNLDIVDGEVGGQARLFSMESIPLDDAPDHVSATKPEFSLHQEKFEEYHLKPKAKMLPMCKIRPTIGTNLAKVDMHGAKCHFFDVGGKLQSLWERYYDDCDAVIFCWKLGEDPEEPTMRLDDEEDEEPVDFSKQQEVLNQVRKAIPDDVPFLIFGHVFGNVNVELVDKMYYTDVVFPHYHNNLTSLFCGSAKTGAGIPQALEWLVPLAKRQQRERVDARKKLGKDEEKEI